MANLQEIKGRIKGAKAAESITRSVSLISNTRFQMAVQRYRDMSAYFDISNKATAALLDAVNDDDLSSARSSRYQSLLKSSKDSHNSLVVVFSSDTKLCGGFNNKIIKEFDNFYANNTNARVATVGNVASKSFAKRKDISNYKGRLLQGNFDIKSLSTPLVTSITDSIASLVRDLKINNIYIAYMAYNSTMKQEAKVTHLFHDFSTKEDSGDYVDTDINIANYLDSIIYQYIKVSVYHIALQNLLSEYINRVMAMESASKNAAEVLYDLELMFNKARQAGITRELMEVISGAEAVS